MKRLLVSLALVVPQMSFALTDRAYDLIPIWQVRSSALNDTVYTGYFNDRNISYLVDSYDSLTPLILTGYIPCALDTHTGPNGETPYTGTMVGSDNYEDNPIAGYGSNQHGYTSNPPLNFSCAQPASTAPLYRLHKSSPHTQHVWCNSVADCNNFEHQGYVFDRVEGYLFTTASEDPYGTYPIDQPLGLYRLHKLNADGSVEYHLTTNLSSVQSHINAGWTNDGVLGYVYMRDINHYVDSTGYTGTFNGQSVTTGSTVVQSIYNAQPPAGTYTFAAYNSGVPTTSTKTIYGMFGSNVTARPQNVTTENLSFDIYTGDIFNNTNSGFSHAAFYLRFSSNTDKGVILQGSGYYGVALLIANPSALGCGTAAGGQLFFESIPGGSCPGGIYSDPALATPLANSKTYTVHFSVNDSAQVTVSVTDKQTGTPLHFSNGSTTFIKSYSTAYTCPLSGFPYGSYPVATISCLEPVNSEAFPVGSTGYFITPVFSQSSGALDTSASIGNISVYWN